MDDILLKTFDTSEDAQDCVALLQSQDIQGVIRKEGPSLANPFTSTVSPPPPPRFAVYVPKDAYSQAFYALKRRRIFFFGSRMPRWGLYLTYGVAIASVIIVIAILIAIQQL